MRSEPAMAMSGARATRIDTPWRRLPWMAPLALIVWAMALWAMSMVLTKAPAMPEKILPVHARFIELPKPPAPAKPDVRPEPSQATSPQPHRQARTMRRAPAKSADSHPADTAVTEPAASSTTTAADLSQPSEALAPVIPGAAAEKRATTGNSRFASHPNAAVRAGAVGVIPPPQDLTIANEENPFDDGHGQGWSPGGWTQESNAEDCVSMPDNPGPCPGQVFTQPGRPWCHDASPLYNWDMGTCQDRFSRATAAFKRQNYAAAFVEFTDLAEKDYAPAQASLCTMYIEGTGTPQDAQKAAYWCRKAAAAGDSKATYNLAVMYSDGIGVPRDDKQAAHWYRKAAYYGYAVAQYNLAVMYTHGVGVPQDDRQAVSWYRKAAMRGNALAQYNLGVMYAEGAGVPRDEKQAAYWYCKGTIRGEEKAQASLAKLYSSDLAEPEKKELSYFCWLFTADKRNSAIAYADRHVYTQGLTTEQRERATATADIWKRK